jgi:sulfur-carrier protein
MSTATAPRLITVRYFAWVREKVGTSEEQISVPHAVITVADLIAWLQSRHDGYASAFAKPGVIRAAIDHKHVKLDTVIGDAREIGFFPPVTGG